MGRRGPQPKGEYAGKSQVFSSRIRPDLRERLVESAKKSGRSISQEVEHRLRRTFIEDGRIEDMFGTRRNLYVMRIVAQVLQTAKNPANPKVDWLDDPYAFNLALKSLLAVLRSLAPGDVSPELSASDKWNPAVTAINTWFDIEHADPALPLKRGTRKQHLDGLLKVELGGLVDRISKRRLRTQADVERGQKLVSKKGRKK